MKAFFYTKTGQAADVLEICEFPTPRPRKGQVRVQVRASGVNPSDTKRRSGQSPQPFPIESVIPHSDGSGVIDRLGAGVDDAWLGKRVWFHNAQWDSPQGAAGEYVTLPLEHVACLPEQVPFDAGATFGVPLLTAWYAVHCGGNLEDKTVFISGGAGSVGAYAIQLAKKQRARVITTVSGPEKARIARKFGADHVINYREENTEAVVREITGGDGVAHCIEVNLSANANQIPRLLAQGGTAAIYGSEDRGFHFENILELFSKRLNLAFFLVYNLPADIVQQAKQEIHELLVNNQLQFHVGQVFEFSEIAKAHEAVEQGSVTGNVVLCQCPAQISDYLQKLDKIS